MSADRLLLDEPPLIVLRSLVRALGDHAAAAFLQQVHFRSRTVHDGKKWAVQTTEEWCEDVCLTVKQLRRVTEMCVDMGLIIREAVNASNHDRTAWSRVDYQALSGLVAEQKRADPCRPKGQTPERPKGRDLPPSRGVEEKNSSSPSGDGSLQAYFDEFWNLYPRKVGKAHARRAYAKALPIAGARVLNIAAARERERYEASPPGERKFFKHPTSWLNAGCWEDEIEAPLFTNGRAVELLAETAGFFTKYARNVPLDKIEATIGWMMARGYGEGETMMRLGVQAALWPEGLAIPNTVMKIPVTVVPRFQGRARQWDDMPDEPYAALIERAWRGRKWLCQK